MRKLLRQKLPELLQQSLQFVCIVNRSLQRMVRFVVLRRLPGLLALFLLRPLLILTWLLALLLRALLTLTWLRPLLRMRSPDC